MLKSYLLLSLVFMLNGCVGAMMESAQISSATATRNEYMDAALAGDAEAQYRVGKSYCCAPRNDVDAFYNNHKATDFLCMAARQNHATAAYTLGRIYSGDTIDGVRLLRRAVTAVRGDDLENPAIAYYWLHHAAAYGHPEAAAEIAELDDIDISMYTSPKSTPCTLREVYGD